MSDLLDVREQLPGLYSHLIAIAERELRRNERPGHTWRPSDLTSETILKLFESEKTPKSFENDRVFFAYVNKVMRSLLINYGRRRAQTKNGGQVARDYSTALKELEFRTSEFDQEKYSEIDALIEKLEARDERGAEIFRLRWQSGESISAIAKIFGLAERTIQKELQTAMAWIKKELNKLDG